MTGAPYDFGPEPDEQLPIDPQFDAWISQVAPEIRQPPATPRAEMWDAIAGSSPTVGKDAAVIPIARKRWAWPVAIAAALLLGIGIDRLALRTTGPAVSAPLAITDHASTDSPNKLYRLAAVQTLTQAEALLTAYKANNVAISDPASARQMAEWARQVLSSTRLLMDSPAGSDPQLKPLFADLELVLVQIIRLSGAPLDASERALVDGAINDHNLLPRLRTAVPAGQMGDVTTE